MPQSLDKVTLDHIDTLLTNIRTNLSNILNTWGAESQQYASAVGIMLAALTENMERLRSQVQCATNEDREEDGSQVTETEAVGESLQKQKERGLEIGRSIEELMRDLALGSKVEVGKEDNVEMKR